MSATLSLILFSGILLAMHFFTRVSCPEFKPDIGFSNTLKGIAMLMILYHHSGIYHSKVLWFFYGAGWGFCGVSLFFFVSGFGLMRSRARDDSGTGSFLGKRWLRLGPTIMLCMFARYLLNPLMVQHFEFPLDICTLMGLKEWYLVALFSWYILFILMVKNIPVLDMLFVFFMAALLIWALLDIISSTSPMVELWIRFPFSFFLGVICGLYSEKVIHYFKHRLLLSTTLSSTAVCLACNLQSQKNLVYPMLDLAILPLGICLVIWLYRLNCNSKFILFLGRHSLPLYLLQVPLIKYGVFMTRWRNDIVGLLVTWLVIFVASMVISRVRFIVDSGTRQVFQKFRV